MSMFFKALEHAEHDGNGRQPERTSREPLPCPPPPSMPCACPMSAAPSAMPAAPPTPVRQTGRRVSPRPREIDEHLVSLVEPSSFASEQYRVLRHALEQLHRTAGHSIFAIGSPSAADGKTTTALNLAGALGQARDARVLLIEADLRCPTMAERLGLDDEGLPGLVEAIQSPDASIADVARRLTDYNLSVMLAGETPATPYEVLKSPRLGELLAEARRLYDYVVIDTPPIVAFPDCRILNSWVDGWLIVVAAHRTPRKLLEESLDLMEESKTSASSSRTTSASGPMRGTTARTTAHGPAGPGSPETADHRP